MRWCDRRGIGYILGLPRNAVLERLALGVDHPGPMASSPDRRQGAAVWGRQLRS